MVTMDDLIVGDGDRDDDDGDAGDAGKDFGENYAEDESIQVPQRYWCYSVFTKRKVVEAIQRLAKNPRGTTVRCDGKVIPVKSRADIVRVFDVKDPTLLVAWERLDLSDEAVTER